VGWAAKSARHAFLLSPLLLFFDWASCGRAADTRIRSPNGSLEFRLAQRESHLTYCVTFKNKPVIEASPLGMLLDGVDLTDDVELGEIKRSAQRETYPWRGIHSQAMNHCNVAAISLTHAKSRTRFTLEVRALDDAVAFRHIIPGDAKTRVPDEATKFMVPPGSTVWHHDLEGHYEAVHTQNDVSQIKEGEWAAPPMTFKLPGGAGYASITEAALVNYSGMALQADGRRGFNIVLGHKHPASYPFRLRYSNDVERVSAPAGISGTIASPWRVVLIGAALNTLVNADAVHNLCPPPDPKLFPRGIQTDRIKPGRAVWKYLDGGANTFDEMKEFSRWAGELGFDKSFEQSLPANDQEHSLGLGPNRRSARV